MFLAALASGAWTKTAPWGGGSAVPHKKNATRQFYTRRAKIVSVPKTPHQLKAKVGHQLLPAFSRREKQKTPVT